VRQLQLCLQRHVQHKLAQPSNSLAVSDDRHRN
jgi:hypothetical protein